MLHYQLPIRERMICNAADSLNGFYDQNVGKMIYSNPHIDWKLLNWANFKPMSIEGYSHLNDPACEPLMESRHPCIQFRATLVGNSCWPICKKVKRKGRIWLNVVHCSIAYTLTLIQHVYLEQILSFAFPTLLHVSCPEFNSNNIIKRRLLEKQTRGSIIKGKHDMSRVWLCTWRQNTGR